MSSVKGNSKFMDPPWNSSLASGVLTREYKRKRTALCICYFRPCISSHVLNGTVEVQIQRNEFCLSQRNSLHCSVFQATVFCFDFSLTQIHKFIEF